jgi:hypothetical protein
MARPVLEDFMRRPRTPAKLFTGSIHRQLNAYVSAATAAGVATLALVQPAEGKIVYTPTHLVFKQSSNITRHIDLNHDGIPDFRFLHFHNSSSNFFSSAFYGGGSNKSNLIMGRQTGCPYPGYCVFALTKGANVGPGQGFQRDEGLFAVARGPSSFLNGYWGNGGKGVKNGYAGLQFVINGKLHYGWARLTLTLGAGYQAHSIRAVITGYAYETIPNKPIIAGKTHDEDDIDPGPDASLTNPIPDIPRPASLGALAMGASGLSIWRRKESVGAAQ